MVLTMMGILGTTLRMALNKPRLGVVPPPSPRFPQSSKRLAPPFAALFSVRVRESITSYEIGAMTYATADSTESIHISIVSGL